MYACMHVCIYVYMYVYMYITYPLFLLFDRSGFGSSQLLPKIARPKNASFYLKQAMEVEVKRTPRGQNSFVKKLLQCV